MVFAVLWQIFTRFILASPSSWTDELSRYLLIWIGLLGGAYAYGKDQHLSISLLPDKLSGRSRLRLLSLIDVLILLFAAGILIYGGIRLVALSFQLQQTSAALQLPLGVVYLAVPLSGLFTGYTAIYRIMSRSSFQTYPHRD